MGMASDARGFVIDYNKSLFEIRTVLLKYVVSQPPLPAKPAAPFKSYAYLSGLRVPDTIGR